MSLDCNQTKERLEELIDQIVDAGLRLNLTAGTAQNKQESALALTLSEECQEHLNSCSDCRDYQSANRMLIEAAAVLPIQAVPQADLLTANIMQMIMEEPAYAPAEERHSVVPSKSEIYLVLLSFAAFAATSAYGLQLDDSLWNIGAWSIALLLFAALKPLIEQPSESRTLKNIGMPA